ncbi:MAG: replication initiator, partial [Actinomycetota bacterium]
MTLELSNPSPVVVGDILSRANSPGYEDWWAKVTDSGFCASPVRLERTTSEAQTEVFVRCKNRRASVCPSCSQLYAGDTWELVHAGIAGDEELLTGHPMVFATLTAPSFGSMHSTGPLLGEPRCPDRYDYLGHVLFTWHAPALWHRFTVGLRRLVTRHCPSHEGGVEARVSYVKVVELQRRAIPHFHTVIWLDHSSSVSAAELGALVRQAGSQAALRVRA